ncbi:MAG: tetratricopeptide repeat protein [Verrucomicrobiota bacterium]
MKTATPTTTSVPIEPTGFAGALSASESLIRTSRHLFVLGALLIVVTLLIYQPAWHGGLLLDDKDHLITTTEERSLRGLADLWIAPHTTRQYHPVLDTVYWLEDKLWGQSTLGYHLVTIFLHGASAALLFTILRQLRVPGAWLAAAIFALHPVHVESVAWMVELKNTLSGVFFFAAILAYLRFDEKRTAQCYCLVLLFFTLGVLVKAIVATLPAVILLIFWWKRRKLDWKRDVLPLIPFLVLGAAAGILTGWMERALAGAEGEEFEFSAIERVLIAGRAFWFYLEKLFWPTNLSLIYPRWKVDSSIWWQYLFPLGALCLFAISWVMRRQWRWLLASLLFFAVTVAPLLGFFNVNFFRLSFVADHFQYLPSIGIITPFAAGAAVYTTRLQHWHRAGAYALSAALLATLAALTWQQAHLYRDAEISYRSVIERNPSSWEANLNVGGEFLKKGSLDEATLYFRRVLELAPDYAPAAKRAYVSLGNVFLKRGKWDESISYLEKSLQFDRNYATAHTSLGSVLHRKGMLREALAHYEIALRLRPNSAFVQSNLAWVLATCADPLLRDGPRALVLAEQANKLSGDANPRVLRSLAAAYAENGQFSLAIEAARRALQMAHDQGQTPFNYALQDEIARYQMARPYHEVAE